MSGVSSMDCGCLGWTSLATASGTWYLTVVVDHLSGRVVWAGKERKAKMLLRFFRKLYNQSVSTSWR